MKSCILKPETQIAEKQKKKDNVSRTVESEFEIEEKKAKHTEGHLPRKDLFRMLRAELSRAKTAEDIAGLAFQYQEAIESYLVNVCTGFSFKNKAVNTDALAWLPDDAPAFSPIQIYGDGNCLPRCASVFAYGTQEHFDEMRIRIALELASHPEAYLDNNFLRAGHLVADDLPKQYAMYSDQYTVNDSQQLRLGRFTSRRLKTLHTRDLT